MSNVELNSVSESALSARCAARKLATLSEAQRQEIFSALANRLWNQRAEILKANARDCELLLIELKAGRTSQALFDRLQTSERGVSDMVAKVHAVAQLPDPIGKTLAITELDDNLTLRKVSCPLGVIGVVFESRPDVIPQVGALCLKSGNAVLLKGGKEATHTNELLVHIWRQVLAEFDDELVDVVSLLHTRHEVTEMLELSGLIDLIVPRGSKDFVTYVAAHSSIPVLGNAEGVCHIYVDQAANLEKAWDVSFDAKTNYPAACNAVETLLVHEEIAPKFLPEMIKRFHDARVAVRGCERTRTFSTANNVEETTDADWATEYSDLIIAVKVVTSFDEAVAHIDRHGSHHTEAIITEDPSTAQRFMELIDAAGVFHNASTRFADGFRYGLGAELGISTSKLHARGPVGLEGLTTYKYQLFGDGHTVSEYQARRRSKGAK